VARAFHVAMQGRPGPVVVALPEDMLRAQTVAEIVARVEPAEAAPSPRAMVELARLLAAAERPFVIAGGSGWTAASCLALERFAERWMLPVGCAFRFQDVFDNRHPNYAGDVGIGISPKLSGRIAEADLIVAIGARLGEMTTGGYELLRVPRPAQRLVHIHAGAEELGRVYAADLLVNASMACAAPALAALDAPAAPRWAAETREARVDYEANLVPEPVAPLDMAEVVKTMVRLVPADTIFTNGAGNFSGWLHRFHSYAGLRHAGRTQLAPTSGAMGYGFPAAVAAALLQPHRQVVNLAGDGDFLMTGQEMATAIAHGVKRLVCIVVDNGCYGTIRMHQEREYPGRVSGSDLGNPDFAALARAYGWAAGERVATTAAFEPALRAALEADRPALIHLRLDADVITSRTTLHAIREAAMKRAPTATRPA
jgi:acetolactate synthase I/II/III large subunit